MDVFERFTIKIADKILVNSNFTANVVVNTLKIKRNRLEVLYPTLNIEKFAENYISIQDPPTENLQDQFKHFKISTINSDSSILLSINRYEKKKNIKLAVQAVGLLPKNKRPILIIAGGYDSREKENIEYKIELEKEVEKLGLQKNVMFLTNITDSEKIFLLSISDCLIYTPQNEHFGIVPLEAMTCCTPVVAMKSGGPIETVNEQVGILVPHKTEKEQKNLVKNTSLALEKVLADSQSYMANCKSHVRNNFSFEAFQARLLQILLEMSGYNDVKRD